MREVIAAPRPGLDLRQHYGHHQSPAIRAGGLIFCSGMLPIDPETGERRHGTLTEEAHASSATSSCCSNRPAPRSTGSCRCMR